LLVLLSVAQQHISRLSTYQQLRHLPKVLEPFFSKISFLKCFHIVDSFVQIPRNKVELVVSRGHFLK
jgi:hypothetical protein